MRRLRSSLVVSSPAGKLFLASFLSLFLELALIRWIPGTVHSVGFFTNLVLIGSFLGLGIGMARSGSEEDEPTWPAFFRLAVVVAVLGLIHVLNPEVTLPSGGDYSLNEAVLDVGISIPLPAVLIGVFGLVVWTTIPLGRLVASPFDRMERIRAYSINIAGSLAGVVAFSLLAWANLPPEVWFAAGLGVLWAIDRRTANVMPALVIAGVLFSLLVTDTKRFRHDVSWSPYYKVITRPVVEGGSLDRGFLIDVNDQFLLSGLDLRPGASLPGADPKVASDVEMLKSYYSLPFQLRPVRRVLVLGAGAGNDVAAALRNGVEHVTAVEIDPLVLSLGKAHHPERPYDSPNVSTVLNDARAYLNRTSEKFDLIIFATLDAHGLLSGAANVRLDSFVYTRESLEAAKKHLSDDGLLVLSFGPFRDDIQLRQYSMVRALFDQDPIYLSHRNGHRTIVSGDIDGLSITSLPREWKRIGQDEIARDLRRFPHALRQATDDWPHLYIRERRVPTEYLGVLAGIVLVALLLVRRSFRGARRLDGQFFFLGAGFLLMETKSVTEYALLVGSTWKTNSVVFTVILATILVANLLLLTKLRRPPMRLLYGLVVLTLGLTYLWPISRWGLSPGVGAYAAAAVYLGVPIFLAAIIFATAFRGARLGSEALASNLLGAVLGGTLEYLSLALGIRALSLIAAAMYVCAFMFWTRTRRAVPATIPEHRGERVTVTAARS